MFNMALQVTASAAEKDRHLYDVYALLFHNEKLYSASEDGKIKVWSPELQLLSEFQAHETVVYHIAILNDTLYSCSNDGTIQAWSLDDFKHKKTLLKYDQDVYKLYAFDGKLYSGDNKGVLSVWENDERSSIYNMVEEIRDFSVSKNLVFTVRDRDVVISEPHGSVGKYVIRQTLDGSSPLCVVGDKLCFAARSGKEICVHANSKETKFKELAILQGHNMIINALSGFKDSALCSGGYDGMVKKWDLNSMQCVGTYDINACINTLCIGSQNQVYAGGANGFIMRIDGK